jgi:CRP-like cAMP-binding protein
VRMPAATMPERNLVEKVIALEGVELLKNLNPDQLARIASIAKEVHFPADKTIMEPGKPLDSLFVILEGTVTIGKDGPLTTAHQGDVLGTWALFDTEPLPVTAKTAEDTELLRIGRDDFYDLLSDNMEITAAIFAILVKRFRQLVQQ